MSSLELQKAIVARLRADSGVDGLVDDRIYQTVPPAPTFPYISLGPDQTLPSRADCYDGSEITLQIDAWSRAPGFQEIKQIAEVVRLLISDAPLTLAGYRLIDIYLESSQTLLDPDGLTTHAVITFRALTEPE